MAAVVQADSKGRILLPLEVRRRLRSRRFELKLEGDEVVLRALTDFRELKGKYRHLIKGTIEQLEEAGERIVREGRR